MNPLLHVHHGRPPGCFPLPARLKRRQQVFSCNPEHLNSCGDVISSGCCEKVVLKLEVNGKRSLVWQSSQASIVSESPLPVHTAHFKNARSICPFVCPSFEFGNKSIFEKSAGSVC